MSSTPEVYLDSASSTRLHPAARDTLLAALERGYADPRRLHGPGRDARLLLDNARAVLAECLDVRPDEVGLTASGTEAVHRGLLGLTAAGGRSGIAHTAVEHSAVLHAVQWRDSPAHASVPVDARGRVDVDLLAAAARREGVGAVAVQAANQEVGTTQPVDDLDLPDDVPLLVDAAAAIGHVPLPHSWQVLTGSAHKWGGPAGVGVLVVRRGTRWTNPFPGEDGLDHPGFPDVPTAKEQGLPDYQVATWYGLWAPKGTPKDVIERMQSELQKALNTPELKEAWTGLGAETPNLYGEAFGRFVSAETRRWAEVVKASGAKLD